MKQLFIVPAIILALVFVLGCKNERKGEVGAQGSLFPSANSDTIVSDDPPTKTPETAPKTGTPEDPTDDPPTLEITLTIKCPDTGQKLAKLLDNNRTDLDEQAADCREEGAERTLKLTTNEDFDEICENLQIVFEPNTFMIKKFRIEKKTEETFFFEKSFKLNKSTEIEGRGYFTFSACEEARLWIL